MKQRRELNCNNPEAKEMRPIYRLYVDNKSIRKDISYYNQELIQQTTERNKSLKVLWKNLNNGRREIIQRNNKEGHITDVKFS